MEFREGERVILREDPEEGWPEESGVVEGRSGTTTWIVRVDKEHLLDTWDDGLREVPEDMIEREVIP